MPKAAPAQTGFTTGEVSPLFFGDFDNPRYKKGLETCLNYLPTLQGPLIRRPGTKFMAVAMDNTDVGRILPPMPSVLIPFNFSATQAYMLEVGHQRIRFYANNGQIVTSGTSFQVTGLVNPYNTFYATRANLTPIGQENITASTSIPNGTILELVTPYSVVDVAAIRFAQNQDTLYLVHPNYPPMKLQRQGQTYWSLYPVFLQDGPYLPLNSYKTTGDSTFITLTPLATTVPVAEVQTGPQSGITAMVTDPGGSGQIKVTINTGLVPVTGSKVYIEGVVGTTEANNFDQVTGSYNAHPAYWVIQALTNATFLLLGSTFANAYISGGIMYPALFADDADAIQKGNPTLLPDKGRAIALTISGVRYWGIINGQGTLASTFNNASRAYVYMGGVGTGGATASGQTAFPSTTTATAWQLGSWSGFLTTSRAFLGTGWPGAVCFHQNRLGLAGAVNYPQEVDLSNTGAFETFSPSDPATGNVKDNNSLQFNLNSDDANALRWLKSTSQGLLAGSYVSEWAMTPASTSEALTPTNFNAQQTSFFGTANIQPVQIGNAVIYISRAQRKVREMHFFFQVGTFRSTDLTEISEHITLPTVTQLAIQKETQPLVWGVRSDGNPISMAYSRDDSSLAAGWSRHQLGGQSDSAGTNPVMSCIASIPDPTISFDQMWMVVKRYINGGTVFYVEYMSKIWDASILQEDALCLDCAGTLDAPLTITAITTASPPVVTSAAHGLANGATVRIVSVVGLNKKTTDANGNVTTTNLVNEKTFKIANVATNTFELNDFNGNPINGTGYSAYVSGGQARKLVTSISGLTWLEGETVGVLTDGGIHPDAVVSNSGVLTLNYPAAKVQIGYRYKSQGKLLRIDSGAADGTSIGKTRRTTRAAMQVYRVGDLAMGTSFENLIPVQLAQADQNQADNAVPLFSGIIREGLESAYDFESQLCFEQSSPLPGVIQSVTSFMEEFDI